jgi:hypothetical protein
MFIGAIHLNLLIRESLELPKGGERKRSFPNTIEVVVEIVFV